MFAIRFGQFLSTWGNNPSIPDEFRLPPEFRAFVGSASDQEIVDAVVKAVVA